MVLHQSGLYCVQSELGIYTQEHDKKIYFIFFKKYLNEQGAKKNYLKKSGISFGFWFPPNHVWLAKPTTAHPHRVGSQQEGPRITSLSGIFLGEFASFLSVHLWGFFFLVSSHKTKTTCMLGSFLTVNRPQVLVNVWMMACLQESVFASMQRLS